MRCLRRFGLWLCTTLVLIVLLLWVVRLPRYEFRLSEGYSIRVGESRIDVRMWSSDTQIVDGQITPAPDTYSPPMWLWLAVVGLPASMLWRVRMREYRYARRLRRGLCPACAYPIGASERCTECGKALPSRRVAGADSFVQVEI